MDKRKTKSDATISKIKRPTTRSMKPAPTNVIKHQVKIANGMAFKVNDGKSGQVSKLKIPSTSRQKSSAKLVKCVSEDFLFGKSAKNASALEFEVIDSIETVEKQQSDLLLDEYVEHEERETDSTSPLVNNVKSIKDSATEKMEENEDLLMILSNQNEEEHTRQPCIDKEQTIKFGLKNLPKPRKRCGFVECFTNNNTFCLKCSNCGVEFEIWDWQQFIEHINEKHIPKRKAGLKNKTQMEDSSADESQSSITTPDITAKSQIQDDVHASQIVQVVEEDVEVDAGMAFDESIEQDLKGNLENYVQESDDSVDIYKHTTESDVEIYNEEDWQVDTLEEYEDIKMEAEPPVSNVNIVEFDEAQKVEVDVEAEIEDEDEDEEGAREGEDDEVDYDVDDGISQAVINFETTDHNRILVFLKFLKLQPVLWHPRRYGPPIYDEEMKQFLSKFDDTMSPIDFRRSVAHLRHQYKRFTPLTPRGRAKLQKDAFLRESIQIIKEIADKLSKPYAFHCDVCTFCFLDEDRMLTHKYNKHKIGDLPYICSCSTRFAFARQKEAHENMHRERPRFTCKICAANFVFNRLLRDHMNEFHPETRENPLPYACPKCDAKFPSIAKRGHHMQRHKTPEHHCEVCNQSFKTSFRFRHHMKRHQDQRDWVCEHCGKAFIEKRSLNAHLFRIHNDGGLQCVHCRTYFAGAESLETHNRKFHPDGQNLDHMKNIRRRIKRKRKPKQTLTLSKRIFNCKECGDSFRNMWSLVSHKRQTGHNLQCYNCPNCEAVLSSPKTLLGHMRRIHKLAIATLVELRNYLLQIAEDGDEPMSAGEYEEIVEIPAECLNLDEYEIFEAYEVE